MLVRKTNDRLIIVLVMYAYIWKSINVT